MFQFLTSPFLIDVLSVPIEFMRNFSVENLVPLDLELEKTLRKISKGKKEAIEFGDKSMDNLEGFRAFDYSHGGF